MMPMAPTTRPRCLAALPYWAPLITRASRQRATGGQAAANLDAGGHVEGDLGDGRHGAEHLPPVLQALGLVGDRLAHLVEAHQGEDGIEQLGGLVTTAQAPPQALLFGHHELTVHHGDAYRLTARGQRLRADALHVTGDAREIAIPDLPQHLDAGAVRDVGVGQIPADALAVLQRVGILVIPIVVPYGGPRLVGDITDGTAVVAHGDLHLDDVVGPGLEAGVRRGNQAIDLQQPRIAHHHPASGGDGPATGGLVRRFLSQQGASGAQDGVAQLRQRLAAGIEIRPAPAVIGHFASVRSEGQGLPVAHIGLVAVAIGTGTVAVTFQLPLPGAGYGFLDLRFRHFFGQLISTCIGDSS